MSGQANSIVREYLERVSWKVLEKFRPVLKELIRGHAGVYALYCGIFFIASMGLLMTPVISHVLHRFHLDREG